MIDFLSATVLQRMLYYNLLTNKNKINIPGFQLAEVDWQNVVVNSLIVDASVYVAFAYANRSKVENKINK